MKIKSYLQTWLDSRKPLYHVRESFCGDLNNYVSGSENNGLILCAHNFDHTQFTYLPLSNSCNF